jgi:hypothetical protein
MEIEVDIKQTTYSKIRLEHKQIKDVVERYIYNKYNVDKDDWIAEGDLMREIELYGSHSWFEKEVLRKATDFDAFLLKLLKELK